MRRNLVIGLAWTIFFLFLQSLIPVVFPPQLIRNKPGTTVWDFDRDFKLDGIRGSQRYSIDAEGFRVTHPVNYAKKSGPRIFTIGASTTVCSFLDDYKTWPALLEKRLRIEDPSLEIVNAGVDATLAHHQAAMFEHIERYRPDAVLFLLGVNDWIYQIKEAHESAWERFRKKSQFKRSPLVTQMRNLFGLPELPAEDLSAFYAEHIDGRRDPYGRRDSLHRATSREFYPTTVSENFSKSLEEIGRRCRGAKIRCLFLTQPTVYSENMSLEVQRSLWMTPFHEHYTVSLDSLLHLQRLYNSYVTDFANSNNFEIFDLASAISPTAENFVDDVHYSETGAERVALAIKAFLKSRPNVKKSTQLGEGHSTFSCYPLSHEGILGEIRGFGSRRAGPLLLRRRRPSGRKNLQPKRALRNADELRRRV